MPEKLTPHSLRRTLASLLYATGESPVTMMREMGHADEGLALRIYAQTMERDEGDRAKLKALIDGAEFVSIDVDGGSSTQIEAPTADIEDGENR